jgi:hypothetical protein
MKMIMREVYFRTEIPEFEEVLVFTGAESISELYEMRKRAEGIYHVMAINVELRRRGAAV